MQREQMSIVVDIRFAFAKVQLCSRCAADEARQYWLGVLEEKISRALDLEQQLVAMYRTV